MKISLEAKLRGVHKITLDVISKLPTLPKSGLLHLFLLHTSAGIGITEGYDPAVIDDLDVYIDQFAPEGTHYIHDSEGPDDMPAHIKSLFLGTSVLVPIFDGEVTLGKWQEIFLFEFRNNGGPRSLIATVVAAL